MKAFLSFGFYDIREQELVTSPVILENLVDLARAALAQCPGLELCAVLGPQALPLPENIRVPFHFIRSRQRDMAELEAIRGIIASSGDTDCRVMVLRPGQGALFRSRVLHFFEAIREREEPLLVSTTQCTSMVHPMWNLKVADRHFLTKDAVRHPRSGTRLVRSLNDICPELWEAMNKDAGYRPKGSQHLPLLHHYDGALYAATLSAFEGVNCPLPQPHPIHCPFVGGKKENLLLRLPVFQMSRETAIDVATLEALLVKHKHDGGSRL
jgi:hypothetical protein